MEARERVRVGQELAMRCLSALPTYPHPSIQVTAGALYAFGDMTDGLVPIIGEAGPLELRGKGWAAA